MKKQIIIATLALGAFVFGTNNAQAQVGLTDTAETVVNITLADVISIETPATEVTFTYNTATAYNTTQSHTITENLKVTSTRAFDIDAKANGLNFENGVNLIPVSVLSINAVAQNTTMLGGSPSNIVELSTTNQKLMASANLGSELTLDLEYEILATKSSSADILGKASGTYTQTVTYTATTL